MSTNQGRSFDKSLQQSIEEVVHPNPSLYEINLRLTNSSTVGGTPSTSLRTTPEVSSDYLVLSQSFDHGWKAYQVSCQSSVVSCQFKKLLPFLFFNELKDHVLVNNWENGWKINIKNQKSKIKNNEAIKELDNTTIVIIYLPQYLQYLGFLLWIVIPVIILSPTKSKARKPKDY